MIDKLTWTERQIMKTFQLAGDGELSASDIWMRVLKRCWWPISVYPTLMRLQGDGWISSRALDNPSCPFAYRMTQLGRQKTRHLV